MTTQLRPRPLFLRQMGRLFTRPQPSEQSAQHHNNQHRNNTEARVSQPSRPAIAPDPILPPQTFVDYAADGDEPADLALQDLIPSGLDTFNLPHFQPALAATAQPLAIAPSCPINACFLSERPFTEKEMNDAELAELIPLELSKLNIKPKQNVKKETPLAQAPLPDLSKLKKS